MHILRKLFCVVYFVPLCVIAQTDKIETASLNHEIEQLADSDINLPVKEVEVGSGGSIKIERKYRTKIESQYEWHTHLLWESRYVTEGRDNLSSDSLVSVSTEFSLDEFSIVPWLANSAAADYTEFNLNVINGARITDSLTLYAGYNYLYSRFSGEKAIDHEVSLDLAYKWVKHLHALASIYHSFDAHGSFMEVAIEYNNALNRTVHYSMQAVVGVNAEYVPDGHNGWNHFQLRGNASYFPVSSLELYAYTGYNIAINRDVAQYAGDELLKDFVWGGAGLTYLF